MSAAVIDGNGNPLHYSIAFDPVFADFVTSTGLNRLDALMDARLEADFPDGAMEMKESANNLYNSSNSIEEIFNSPSLPY